jgi:hypothetical protein
LVACVVGNPDLIRGMRAHPCRIFFSLSGRLLSSEVVVMLGVAISRRAMFCILGFDLLQSVRETRP